MPVRENIEKHKRGKAKITDYSDSSRATSGVPLMRSSERTDPRLRWTPQVQIACARQRVRGQVLKAQSAGEYCQESEIPFVWFGAYIMTRFRYCSDGKFLIGCSSGDTHLLSERHRSNRAFHSPSICRNRCGDGGLAGVFSYMRLRAKKMAFSMCRRTFDSLRLCRLASSAMLAPVVIRSIAKSMHRKS